MSLKLLRIIAILEGISYLVLLGITMPMKYMLDMPEPTYIVGMCHGVLFTLYVVLVIVVAIQMKWKYSIIFFALLASILPIATFIADKKLFKKANDSTFKRA